MPSIPRERMQLMRKCPKCRNIYTGYPALSRKDNKDEHLPRLRNSRGDGRLFREEEIRCHAYRQ